MSLNIPIIILSMAILVTAAVLKLLKPKQKKEDIKVVTGAATSLNKLRQEYVILKNSVNILRDLSSQYFMTLNSNGFQDLCNIESAFSEAIDCCDSFIEKGNHNAVQEIVSYLYLTKGKTAPPPCLWGVMGERVCQLTDWTERTRELLLRLIESVNQTSSRLKEVGGAARRQRKNTIMMLNDARAALGAGAV